MNQLATYRQKADAELHFIVRDASVAAQAMRSFDARAEAKYLDQVNDACTVLRERTPLPTEIVVTLNPATNPVRSVFKTAAEAEHTVLSYLRDGYSFEVHVERA